MRSEVFCVRVDRDAYDYYAYHTTRLERDWLTRRMKATFAALVEELKKKRGGETEAKKEEDRKEEIVIKYEETLKVDDSTAVRLYKRLQGLEKELTKAVANLEETKEQLEKERSEREKCIQELEAIKKKPESLQKELQKKDVIVKELLELTSLAAYCFETQKCDFSKALNVLKNRLSRMGLEPIRISDVLLTLVTPKA